jgi:hypothetical protein
VRGHTYNGLQGQGMFGRVECSTGTADSMLRACLAEAATPSSFELLQVHYRCMLPRCLHASNGWRRES